MLIKNADGLILLFYIMSIVYRAKFLASLQQMINKGEVMLSPDKDEKQLLNLLYQKQWVVYAKAPFGGP